MTLQELYDDKIKQTRREIILFLLGFIVGGSVIMLIILAH